MLNNPIVHRADPALDLEFERVVDVRPALVWMAWTDPEHLKKWFTPAPWQTVDCEIDLRPGGIFRTTMRSPEGEEFPSSGCYLEIVPERKLVWTSALLPGYRPKVPATEVVGCDFPFTGVITLEPAGSGTRYRALAIHADPQASRQHAEMGFHDGWSSALDQLVEIVRGM